MICRLQKNGGMEIIMAAPKVKVRVMHSTKKAKVKTFATAISEAFKCRVDDVPPAFPCDKERVVFIGVTLNGAPDDKLRLFCRELNKSRAINVALFVDGPKVESNAGLKTIIDVLKEAGTNVLTDDIYYVDGGRALFGSKKISLEERTEIVRWAEAVVEKVSA